MAETSQFKTKIQRGDGYGYIVIPHEFLDAGDTVSVWVSVNGHPDEKDATITKAGDYLVVFNREQLIIMGVRYGQEVDVEMQRRDATPQLNDLPADLLAVLQSLKVEEDFKRLPPERQKEYQKKVVESDNHQERARRVQEIAETIRAEDAELPRGDSL